MTEIGLFLVSIVIGFLIGMCFGWSMKGTAIEYELRKTLKEKEPGQ